jgi:hypothetical protein
VLGSRLAGDAGTPRMAWPADVHRRHAPVYCGCSSLARSCAHGGYDRVLRHLELDAAARVIAIRSRCLKPSQSYCTLHC